MAELKFNENENVRKPVDFDIFNFSSATRGHFSNEYTFIIYGHLVKKAIFILLKDALVIELADKMYQGVLIW